MTENLEISFPPEHYVGRKPIGDGQILGFMTPQGTDAPAVKRKSSVDSWARMEHARYHAFLPDDKRLDAQTFPNEPLEGFSLGHTVQHGYSWHQGDIKWRVFDPRGFQLEITSANLLKIISSCTIEKGGLIIGQMQWARFRNENILVPVDSDDYRAAMRNTERKSKSADIKTLRPGDEIILQNGNTGRYLGKFFELDTSYPLGNSMYQYAIKWDAKKAAKHHYLTNVNGSTWVETIGALKLSEIIPGEPITTEEAMDIILEVRMNSSQCRSIAGKKDRWGFEFKPTSYEAIKTKLAKGKDERFNAVVKQDGKWLSGVFKNEDSWSSPEYGVSLREKKDGSFIFKELRIEALQQDNCFEFETFRPTGADRSWGWGMNSRPNIASQYVMLTPDIEVYECVMFIEHGDRRWEIPHSIY